MNADYTAPPAKRLLLGLLYRLASLAFRWLARRHVDRIVGLEHLPRRGPFVIVANHLSYMDDFLLAYVVRLCCGEKLYIPTNTKAFKGVVQAWLHLAGGAVEIDPGDRAQCYRVLRRLVDDGRIVLMFPEGTRSDGSGLLPFRFGAFNLARDAGVPIVPVTLVDTHRVLPKHALWPVRGARASAVFHPAILPDELASNGVHDARERCVALIASALRDRCAWASGADSAAHLAALAEGVVESLIERGPEMIRTDDLRPVWGWWRLARHAGASMQAIDVQRFRAFGFRLMAAPKWLAPWLVRRFHAMGDEVLRRDRRQPFVHYGRGLFHQRAPRLAGGSRRASLLALHQAYRWAPHYGIDRARFAVSYAQALAHRGHAEQARRVLDRHFGPDEPAGTDRLRRRAARAAELRARLPLTRPQHVSPPRPMP
jgi:1-acyl-sn-glycerol-3-phosphate acyltransferase